MQNDVTGKPTKKGTHLVQFGPNGKSNGRFLPYQRNPEDVGSCLPRDGSKYPPCWLAVFSYLARRRYLWQMALLCHASCRSYVTYFLSPF